MRWLVVDVFRGPSRLATSEALFLFALLDSAPLTRITPESWRYCQIASLHALLLKRSHRG